MKISDLAKLALHLNPLQTIDSLNLNRLLSKNFDLQLQRALSWLLKFHEFFVAAQMEVVLLIHCSGAAQSVEQ